MTDDTLPVINNPDHVLCSLLPPPKDTSYNMRKRKHPRSNFADRTF